MFHLRSLRETFHDLSILCQACGFKILNVASAMACVNILVFCKQVFTIDTFGYDSAYFIIFPREQSTVEPRLNEVAGDRPDLFVKSSVCYIENLEEFVISRFYSIHFAITLARTLYRGLREIEVR